MNTINGTQPYVIDNSNLTNSHIDLAASLKSFYNEMAKLMHDYADLSNDPDPSKVLMIGNTPIRGDQVNSAATGLLLNNWLSESEQAQTELMNIFMETYKLEQRFQSSMG